MYTNKLIGRKFFLQFFKAAAHAISSVCCFNCNQMPIAFDIQNVFIIDFLCIYHII